MISAETARNPATILTEPQRSVRLEIIRGCECLIFGQPNLDKLEECVDGPGDLWHSGPSRGCASLLGELKYWQPCFWWYLNDIDPLIAGVSWRVDIDGFVIRRSAWEALGGLDAAFASDVARGLDLGFRLLQSGGVPLHVPDLYPALASGMQTSPGMPQEDVYLFFVRHFKREYRLYMLGRESFRTRTPWVEWRALREAERHHAETPAPQRQLIPPRPLAPISNPEPSVSVIIPTMRRQEYAANVLEDLARQTLLPQQVFVIDATPENSRVPGIYEAFAGSLPLQVIWQEPVGSCRARNAAIQRCTGDFVVFSDDDIRVPSDFIENHVRLLQTYRAQATSGLDIRADHHRQNLEDLSRKLSEKGIVRDRVGVDTKFSNANSCVRLEWIHKCVGNDANFDGGYGEDNDFGFRLTTNGAVVLFNPHSVNLHLKPPAGGFRWWGQQMGGAKRSRKPWEIRRTIGLLHPRPSPTIMYGFRKHYTKEQQREWLLLYMLRYWWPVFAKPEESKLRRLLLLFPRMLETPLTLSRVRLSRKFADDLLARGPLYE